MKHYCAHCGQSIETETTAADGGLPCPACGEITYLASASTVEALPAGSGVSSPRKSRFGAKDVIIGISALLLVLLLALLFLRPNEPARRLVFGDIAPPAAPKVRSPETALAAHPDRPTSDNGFAFNRTASGSVPGMLASNSGVGSVPASGTVPELPTGQLDNAPTNQASVPSGTAVGTGPPPAAVSPSTGLPGLPSQGPPSGIQPQPTTTSISPADGLPSTQLSSSAETPNGSTPGPGSALPPVPSSSPPQPASSPVTTPGARSTGSPAQATTPASAPVSPTVPGALTTAESPSSTDTTPPPSAKISPEEVAKERTTDLLPITKSESKPATLAQDPTSPNPATPAPANPVSPDSPTSPAGADGAGAPGSLVGKDPDKKLNSAQAFDPERGTNIVFVLDRSRSMNHGDKSLVARRELVDALEHLGPDKSFFVLFFPFKAMPAEGPLPATMENIQRMTNWIFSLGHKYDWSGPTEALLKGFEFNPDTMWLLSDGKFSSSVATALRKVNKGARVRIHTVGFYSHEGEAILRQIAEENGGTYRFVPPPGERPSGENAPTLEPGTPPAQPTSVPQ